MTNKIPAYIKKKLKNYPVFYQKVWMECFKIPYGKTITYKKLAENMRIPNSARAVGNALSKNPFAPVIPCHRVVKSDGRIGGYSGTGGIKTKKKLIEKEKNG
ncbi:MAG: MGMT family protein [Elusimicrobia bacterium]|nr:MGMT family protein [Elusimicrobiota bacterium]